MCFPTSGFLSCVVRFTEARFAARARIRSKPASVIATGFAEFAGPCLKRLLYDSPVRSVSSVSIFGAPTSALDTIVAGSTYETCETVCVITVCEPRSLAASRSPN